MKIKSILVKSIAVAAMSVTGLVVANNAGSNTAQAAIVQNDASVVTVTTFQITQSAYTTTMKTQ